MSHPLTKVCANLFSQQTYRGENLTFLAEVRDLLTGGVEKTGLVAGVVDPLLTVQGGVGQSSHFVPGGIPVVDISYVRPIYGTPKNLGTIHSVMHDHRPGFISWQQWRIGGKNENLNKGKAI